MNEQYDYQALQNRIDTALQMIKLARIHLENAANQIRNDYPRIAKRIETNIQSLLPSSLDRIYKALDHRFVEEEKR